MTTGERIKERRLQLGITAEKLAEEIGVTKSTISRYENLSIKKIPYINLLRIADALKTTIKDLADDEKEPIGESNELAEMIDEMEDLQKQLIQRIAKLSPDKAALVDAFVQGISVNDQE